MTLLLLLLLVWGGRGDCQPNIWKGESGINEDCIECVNFFDLIRVEVRAIPAFDSRRKIV